ncbi:MAG: hypothetical protein J6Q15_00155 [Clostridia bacterium]|nr:hypothetical protein [Clostridia bacterium]
MDKTQEKFFKLLKLLDDCRNKLRATYNLFMSCLEQTKNIKGDLGGMYEQMLDYRDEMMQIASSKKPAKTKLTKLATETNRLKDSYNEQIELVTHIMDDCESCRKTYKHEVSLCCQTYNMLKQEGLASSIVKGYKQQVKLIRAILDKIDDIKDNYKQLKAEIKQEKEMFDKLYVDVNKKIIEIK